MKFATAMQEAASVLGDLDLAYADPSAPSLFDESRLQPFLQSEEAARGFFVVLLTGDYGIGDHPPAVLLAAISHASEEALSVLTRNLAMSAATQVVHRRNNDKENEAGSERVLRRTKQLFLCSQCLALAEQASKLRKTLLKESDEFSAFLARVNYDDEQKSAVLNALQEILRPSA